MAHLARLAIRVALNPITVASMFLLAACSTNDSVRLTPPPDSSNVGRKRPPANPDPVTDLRVSAVTDTSATLAFTQAGDGTGAPADYDIRSAVAPILWGSAASVARGT